LGRRESRVRAVREKPTILVVSLSHLHRDPRVHRQLKFLEGDCRLIAAGYSDPQLEGVEFVMLPKRRPDWRTPRAIGWRAGRHVRHQLTGWASAERRHEWRYWDSMRFDAAWQALRNMTADLIVANDIEALPVAARFAERAGAKLLVDVHEWKPGNFDGDPQWKDRNGDYWSYVCREYLPRADAMFTVCGSIADLYTGHFGVTCDVITNAPFYAHQRWTDPRDGRIRMIYHGSINRNRRLESMLELMELLDERFSLDLMLVEFAKEAAYGRQLRELAAGTPRVAMRPPVPMPEIAEATNQYDVGLFLLDPSSTSYRLALPNKLFEYIQARLAIAIWPSPEMKRLVEEYDVGVVSESFDLKSMARKLKALTVSDLRRFKENSHRAAKELCAEKNRTRFLAVVHRLLGVEAPEPCAS
jgi:hypothetical protein